MSALPYCFLYVVVLIAASAFNNVGASPREVLTGNQDLQKIVDAIQELSKAVSNSQSSESVLKVAEVLRSQQTTLSQCQPLSHELVFQLGEIKHKFEDIPPLFEAAIKRIEHLEERLLQVETTSSQAKDKSRTNEGKIKDLVQNVEALSKGPCQSPFYQVGHDCLYVDHKVMHTWSGCRSFCKTFGGDLAVPSDIIKLRGYLASLNKAWSYWIGGSDEKEEGKWIWVNGHSMDLSVGWKPREPNNGGGKEHCVYYYGAAGLHLNDAPCSIRTHCVCQIAGYLA